MIFRLDKSQLDINFSSISYKWERRSLNKNYIFQSFEFFDNTWYLKFSKFTCGGRREKDEPIIQILHSTRFHP